MTKPKCAFCETPEVKGLEIVSNDLAWAFPTNKPIVPGHILICPIRCVTTFEGLTPDERNAIFELQPKLKKALEKAFDAKGFNYAWNEGKIGGQSVPHFHLHILPRKEGDAGILEYDPRKFLYRTRGGREESSMEELQAVNDLIKNAID